MIEQGISIWFSVVTTTRKTIGGSEEDEAEAENEVDDLCGGVLFVFADGLRSASSEFCCCNGLNDVAATTEGVGRTKSGVKEIFPLMKGSCCCELLDGESA